MNNQLQERAKTIDNIIGRLYPELPQFITYHSPYQLIIAVILTASTTDRQVNKVTPTLFKSFPTVQSLAAATITQVHAIIKSVGLAHSKSRYIIQCAKDIVINHNGTVPSTRAELMQLPGVGRKSSAVIACHLGTEGAVAVDTHFSRVAQRIGLTTHTTQRGIEDDIATLLPDHRLCHFSTRINQLGREFCTARSPLCSSCPIRSQCATYRNGGALNIGGKTSTSGMSNTSGKRSKRSMRGTRGKSGSSGRTGVSKSATTK